MSIYSIIKASNVGQGIVRFSICFVSQKPKERSFLSMLLNSFKDYAAHE